MREVLGFVTFMYTGRDIEKTVQLTAPLLQ